MCGLGSFWEPTGGRSLAPSHATVSGPPSREPEVGPLTQSLHFTHSLARPHCRRRERGHRANHTIRSRRAVHVQAHLPSRTGARVPMCMHLMSPDDLTSTIRHSTATVRKSPMGRWNPPLGVRSGVSGEFGGETHALRQRARNRGAEKFSQSKFHKKRLPSVGPTLLGNGRQARQEAVHDPWTWTVIHRKAPHCWCQGRGSHCKIACGARAELGFRPDLN